MVKAEKEYITEMVGSSSSNPQRGNPQRKPNAADANLTFLQSRFGTTPKNDNK